MSNNIEELSEEERNRVHLSCIELAIKESKNINEWWVELFYIEIFFIKFIKNTKFGNKWANKASYRLYSKFYKYCEKNKLSEFMNIKFKWILKRIRDEQQNKFIH